MCLLWILLQIFIFFFYFDLPPISEEDKQKQILEQESPNSRAPSPTPSQPRDFSRSVTILTSGRPKKNTKGFISQSLPVDSVLAGSYEEGGVVNVTPLWSSSNLVEDPRPRAFSTTTQSRELVNPSDRRHSDVKQDQMQNVDLDSDHLYDPPLIEDANDIPGLSPVKEDDDQQNGSSGYGSTGQVEPDSMESQGPRTWQEGNWATPFEFHIPPVEDLRNTPGGGLSEKVGTGMCGPDMVLFRLLRFTNGPFFI